MRLFKILIFFQKFFRLPYFSQKKFYVPKASSFQFFDILQQNECYKILNSPFFTFFGTMRLSGNFKKIRKIYSQFLVLKDRFFKDRSFFYATFLKFVSTEAPAQFLQETKRFARGLLKALRLTGDHQKCFRKILKFFSIFCWERMGFLLFSVGEEWFSRLTRIPSGIFWRCKIDEISISFYPWFSVWYCLFGFLQKFASVCEARLRLCVKS